MSLIIASSTQEQYGGLGQTRTLAGIEDPSKFSNHFTSPITIPTNAEIAVESVKIRRQALYDIEDNTVFYHYFGKEQTVSGQAGKDSRNSMPIPIKPQAGVYSFSGFADELQNRLNEAYSNPEIYQKHTVTRDFDSATGREKGFKFATTQSGNSYSTERSNIMENVGAVQYWAAPKQLTDAPSITAVSGGTPESVITRVAATTAEGLDDRKASLIGTSLPFGLVQSVFHIETKNCTGGWRIGLSRPQIEYRLGDVTTPVFDLLPGQGGIVPDVANAGGKQYRPHNQIINRNQEDFYDYMVQNDGTDIKVFQCSHDSETNEMVMSEVYYGNAKPITSAVFEATYDGIYFQSFGDEMRLLFRVIGKPIADADTAVAASMSTVVDRCFAPIGETRAALYPRVNILTQNESLKVIHWSSHYSDKTFRYPTYETRAIGGVLTTGDDFYSNNRVGRFQGAPGNDSQIVDTKLRPYCISQTVVCDTKKDYTWNTDPTSAVALTQTQTYVGTVGPGATPTGMAFAKVMIIGFTRVDGVNDYLEGKYRTLETSGSANAAGILGFGSRNILRQSSVAGFVTISANLLSVTFTSTDQPTFRVHSCFVRVSNLGQNSFNGAKQSTSKIIYHLPRFSNDGREFGDLFLTPGEKTYIKLNNAAPIMLNQLDVQLVDVNERPVDDLSGNTIVVFHVK